MPQLDPTYFASQIFWLFVTFVALYIIIAKVVIPRIGGIMQTRHNRITFDLERAENYKKEAEIIEAEYRSSLDDARSKANAAIADANARVDNLAKQRHSELDKELAKKTQEAEVKISAARDKAEQEIHNVAVDLSIIISKNVARIEIDKNKAESAVSSVIREMKKV